MGEGTREKLLNVEKELSGLFFERKEEIRGLIVGLLSREHVLLLGPPGAAKSELAEELCSRIVWDGGEGRVGYFRWLLSRTSTPEELFGPVSLRALEEDSYRRKTKGKLPEARIAFLDEVFECNSAVLNGLLSVLNERLFFNDGEPTPIPLEMVVAASNEPPEEREELEALFDRFLLRYVVSYVREDASFEAMLRRESEAPLQRTSLTAPELLDAQEEVRKVDASGTLPAIAALRRELSEAGVSASDRRYAKSLKLLRANAYLEGREEVTDEDLLILANVLWVEPGQARDVRKKVMVLASPELSEARDLLEEAREVFKKALSAPQERAGEEGQEANAKLKEVTNRLLALRNDAERVSRGTGKIDEALTAVVEMNKEVIHRWLGITI
jgi:MoxR-like ATPase